MFGYMCVSTYKRTTTLSLAKLRGQVDPNLGSEPNSTTRLYLFLA